MAEQFSGEHGLLRDLDDDRKKAQRFKTWFTQSFQATDRWRQDAIESLNFVQGNQWSDDDLAKMRAAHRPTLVINKILSPVLFLLGMQRQQRTEPQILPFEAGDVRKAELMGSLLKWVSQRSREPVVDSKVFMKTIVTGLGFWKIGLDPNELEPECLWEELSPLAVFPDPNWIDSGWEAAEYVEQATWYTIERAMADFPKHKDRIRMRFGEWLDSDGSSGRFSISSGEFAGDTMASDRLFWDAETQRARIVEVWYKKRVKVEVAINRLTQEVEDDEERVERLKEAVAQDPQLAQGIAFIRQEIPRIRVAWFLDEILLDDQESPYREQCFPIFPSVGHLFWRDPFGVVSPMKDSQREINARRSTIVEMVKRAALSGFFNKKTTGADSQDLENYASGVGKVINYDSDIPTAIEPPQLPQTLVFLDTRASQEIREIPNITNELTGLGSQRTISGRAISARQQGAQVVQQPLLESFTQAKEPAVRFAISLIQEYFTVEKAMRVLGSVAARQPQSPEAQMLAQIQIQELQDLLQGTFEAKFDVSIGQKPFDPSQKRQIWDVLLELAQTFGPAIPPDVLIDAAKEAGYLSEEHANRIAAHAQQQQALQQQAAISAAQSGSPPPAEAIQ